MDDDLPDVRLVLPGVSPNSWAAYFTGGPMDGERHGIVETPDLPTLLDWHGDGRYRLTSKSSIDPGADLSKRGLIRGCRYSWEVPSRAETPPLPGARAIQRRATGLR